MGVPVADSGEGTVEAVLQAVNGTRVPVLVRKKVAHRKLWISCKRAGVPAVALLVLAILLIPKLLFADYEGLPTTGPYGVKQVSAILVDENSFPLVIFSHGAFGYYQSNTSTYMELASHGYVVISLDHPYHSFFTKDTADKTITVNPEFLQEVMYINEDGTTEQEIIELAHGWLEIRTGDMNFVLDSVKAAKKLAAEVQTTLPEAWFTTEESTVQEILSVLAMTNTEEIGLMGHSMGGATSVTIGRIRDDIDAVIDLDGTMLGEEFSYTNGQYEFYKEAYPVPLLAISNEAHYFEGKEAADLYVNSVVLANAVDARYTYFKGSGHMNFTDLPLFSPALASFLGVGEVDAEECIVTMNQIILDYFNCYLKNTGEVTINESY